MLHHCILPPKTKLLNKNDWWLASDKMATVGDFSFRLQFDYESQQAV
jgi:hypothetical protein